MMTDGVRFLPYLRTGLAAAHRGDLSDRNADDTYSLTVGGVRMTGRLRLYGPGEVAALEAGEVTRSFPPPGSRDHEPNLFAHVELKTADLPWRFTPGSPTDGKLRPWIVLVVVETSDRVHLESRTSRLPILTTPVPELPDLAESWAWAHVQATLDGTAASDLEALYAGEPHRFLSRLICPRKLEPNKHYLACLVPAFDAGRECGLGGGLSDTTRLADAWTSDLSEISLPVYHSWSFSCSSRGDFELLADRLRPRTAPGDLGVVDLDLGRPGLGLPGIDAAVPMVGALCAPGAERRMTAPRSRAENALADEIWQILSAGASLPIQASDADPIVAPPRYGAIQAGTAEVQVWQRSLNRHPGFRAAAGLGAELVRMNQEELAAAAWEQLEDTAALERTLRRDAFKEAANTRRRERLEALSRGNGQKYLVFARPAFATVSSGRKTFLERLREDSDFPERVAASATARVALRAGKIRRRRSAPAPTAADMTGVCLVPETRPDFAPMPEAGARTVARAVEPVDVSALDVTSSLKNVPSAALMPDSRALGRHPGKDRSKPKPKSPRVFQGDPDVGKDLWHATEPSRFLRSRRRRLVSAGSGLALGRSGPLPMRLRPFVQFPSPFGVELAKLDPEYLLPGIGSVPKDTISLVAVHTAFIEAFLAGMNDEWARELVWRELPAAARATSMRRFWACGDSGDQIPSIDRWGKTTGLGGNATALAGSTGLALLLKGRLLERYPETLIYAVSGSWVDGRREPVKVPKAQQVRWPDVIGELAAGVQYVIFQDLRVAEANGAKLDDLDPAKPGGADPGWFFVLEEQPCAPRFGLDLPLPGQPRAVSRWDELTWAQVTTSPASGTGPRHLTLTPPRGVKGAEGAVWAADSAHMAWIALQTPYRVYIHGSSMLEPDDDEPAGSPDRSPRAGPDPDGRTGQDSRRPEGGDVTRS